MSIHLDHRLPRDAAERSIPIDHNAYWMILGKRKELIDRIKNLPVSKSNRTIRCQRNGVPIGNGYFGGHIVLGRIRFKHTQVEINFQYFKLFLIPLPPLLLSSVAPS